MLYVSLQNIVAKDRLSQETMIYGALRMVAVTRLKAVLGKALQLR